MAHSGTDLPDLAARLHEQLDWHWRTQARPRLEGLTDDELHWEPAPGAWGVRPADGPGSPSATSRAGSGAWLVDVAWPPPEPAPVTTIAWRLAHVTVEVLGVRAASHIGGPPMTARTWDYAGTAADALRQLDAAYASWSAGARALTPEALQAPVGPAEGHWADAPMVDLVLHINRETIHHLAEVALLRDLWAHGAR